MSNIVQKENEFWLGAINKLLYTLFTILQVVSLLSVKSILLILPSQRWSTYDSLGSNWPQDVRNLRTACRGNVGFQNWECN